VDENAAGTVPGLYAAGDTSLVARGHLTGAFVFGEIAAESATAYAERAGSAGLDGDQMKRLIKGRDAKFEQSGNAVPVEEFEYKVRRIINDYIVPPKNEYKLDRALWWMERFREELRTMVRVRDVHDLFKYYEIENIIQCADLSARASKERKESRWGMWHYRTDYPERSDDAWKKHIVLSRGEATEDVRITPKDIIRLEEGAR
jgi:succinate dehydrogenase/fumarate reductase flavoprotein subunit